MPPAPTRTPWRRRRRRLGRRRRRRRASRHATTSCVSPTSIRSPGLQQRAAPSTRAPFTNVPFVDPRSSIRYCPCASLRDPRMTARDLDVAAELALLARRVAPDQELVLVDHDLRARWRCRRRPRASADPRDQHRPVAAEVAAEAEAAAAPRRPATDDRARRVGELGAGRVAIVRILGHRLLDHGVERDAECRAARSDAAGGGSWMCAYSTSTSRSLGNGNVPVIASNITQRERVDVEPRVGRLAQHELGRRVVDRADELAGGGEGDRVGRDVLRQAEVGEVGVLGTPGPVRWRP